MVSATSQSEAQWQVHCARMAALISSIKLLVLFSDLHHAICFGRHPVIPGAQVKWRASSRQTLAMPDKLNIDVQQIQSEINSGAQLRDNASLLLRAIPALTD